jgi:coenzyme Q-binding protein COQ10|tara:strand:- start:142 stop:588 length:447 start_codon:yes stop_codon:yes gene_type:complete
MPRASVKRLIKCKKNQLIDLVLDIEKYPDFVPYCIDAKVHEKNDVGNFVNIIADLTIGKGLFKDTYKSDVKFDKKHNSIYVTNIGGPLKHLNNKWIFESHKEETEIYFDVDFEIKNKFLNILMTTSFQYGLDKIADAFQKRANQLFKR